MQPQKTLHPSLTFTFLISDTTTNIKPTEHSFFIPAASQTLLINSYFLTGTNVGSQTGSALLCICCCHWGSSWLMLSIWPLGLDCSCSSVVVSLASGSWLQLMCCCSEGYSSAASADLMQERPSQSPPSAPPGPWSPLRTFSVATHCAGSSWRNCVCSKVLCKEMRSTLEKPVAIPLKTKG